MTIHTFGDSHCAFGFCKIKSNNFSVVCNNVNATTMMNFSRFKLKVIDIYEFNVQEGDVVLFSLGEIDCRCHVHKFKEKFKTLINEMITGYMDAIKVNVERFIDLKVMVYNIPPTLRGTIYNNNIEYPFICSDEERIVYIKYMNEKLKEHCKDNNFIFLDVYDKYVGDDGLMKYELSDGRIHVDNPIFIEEFLKNII